MSVSDRRAALLPLVLLLAGPAAGDDITPLPHDRFATLTEGRTFRVFDRDDGLYGMESFFPGGRVIWQDADRCIEGQWQAMGAQTCFRYADKADRPVCWLNRLEGALIRASRDGDPERGEITLRDMGDATLSCDGWLGS